MALAAWVVDDPVISSLSSSSNSSSSGNSIKRMPGSSPDVTMGEGMGMWQQDKLHDRFLEALVAVQSSSVRATGTTVWQEMQHRCGKAGRTASLPSCRSRTISPTTARSCWQVACGH